MEADYDPFKITVETPARTRWLSSFNNVQEVNDWLLAHRVYFPQAEIEKIWEARQEWLADTAKYRELDYKLVIHGREHPGVKVYRRTFIKKG